MVSIRSSQAARLNNYIQNGYAEIYEGGNPEEGVGLWFEAWKMVLELIPTSITTLSAADRLFPDLTQSIHNWCQDFEMELGNCVRPDNEYGEKLVSYTTKFLERFPDIGKVIRGNMRMAQIEGNLAQNNLSEINRLAKLTLEEIPNEFWIFIRLGDVLVNYGDVTGKIQKYHAKALKFYKTAGKTIKQDTFWSRISNRSDINVVKDRISSLNLK